MLISMVPSVNTCWVVIPHNLKIFVSFIGTCGKIASILIRFGSEPVSTMNIVGLSSSLPDIWTVGNPGFPFQSDRCYSSCSVISSSIVDWIGSTECKFMCRLVSCEALTCGRPLEFP